VHGFAGPLGGMFPAPHGAVCAALLPHVMRANVAALQSRGEAGREGMSRYDEVARLLTGKGEARSLDGVRWVESLVTDLRIPPLSAYGVTAADFPALIQASAKASSMKANPVALTAGELEAILRRAV
jgi:alcohol dehydrogenase class IV